MNKVSHQKQKGLRTSDQSLKTLFIVFEGLSFCEKIKKSITNSCVRYLLKFANFIKIPKTPVRFNLNDSMCALKVKYSSNYTPTYLVCYFVSTF